MLRIEEEINAKVISLKDMEPGNHYVYYSSWVTDVIIREERTLEYVDDERIKFVGGFKRYRISYGVDWGLRIYQE